MSKDDSPSYTDVRRAAINALSRREHAYQELHRKLSQRFASMSLVSEVLDTLREEKLQSDERYIEAFIRYRKMKGQGPIRIASELRQAGVSENLIADHLDESDEEWQVLASQVHSKRFGGRHETVTKETASKEIAKQQRFLSYRGFTSEQIQRIFRSSE